MTTSPLPRYITGLTRHVTRYTTGLTRRVTIELESR